MPAFGHLHSAAVKYTGKTNLLIKDSSEVGGGSCRDFAGLSCHKINYEMDNTFRITFSS